VIYPNLSWDLYFLGLARYASIRSKDPSTKTGAVIVRPDKTVASMGYNGFPKQMEDKPEWLNERKEKYSRVVHCEMNALLSARERVEDYTLYTWPCASCDRCLVHMAQAGITQYVFPTPSSDMLSRWAEQLEKTKQYLTEMKLSWWEYNVEDVK
jgi:dCMP deaminase